MSDLVFVQYYDLEGEGTHGALVGKARALPASARPHGWRSAVNPGAPDSTVADGQLSDSPCADAGLASNAYRSAASLCQMQRTLGCGLIGAVAAA
jgi:hypothetical protein